MEKVAVIDLGSNSVRLVIFEVTSKGFKVIDDMKETVRLGEGLEESQKLSPWSMEKAILTLKMFRSVCFSYRASLIAVATAAMRKAGNSPEFLQRIKEETGIELRIISGEEEAYLDYIGVINSIDVTDGVIMDIGGGSTELVQFADKQLIEAVSLPFGSLDLTRKFRLAEQVELANELGLSNFLEQAFRKVPWAGKAINGPLIGIGGIIRNIGKIDRKRKKYPLDIAHNYSVDFQDINEIYDIVKNRQLPDRYSIEGLSQERTDIFVGASAAVKIFMEMSGIKKMITSGYGLREGLVYQHIGMLPPVKEDVLDASLDNIMHMYQVDTRHAYHVHTLYQKLFRLLQEVHGIEEDLTRINKTAALLHDIGVNIRFYDHHEHTFYLILNTGITGLSHRELLLSAYIAASHRTKKFKAPLDEYKGVLNKGDKILVRKAGIILQIANSLDRSMVGKIKDIDCLVESGKVTIRLTAEDNCELEKKDALCAADNFKKIFERELVIL